jgi:hypothetical protein
MILKTQSSWQLWAKYAKIIEKNNSTKPEETKVINNEGQTFVMQSIYWDKANQRMYTKDTVFITDKDGSNSLRQME